MLSLESKMIRSLKIRLPVSVSSSSKSYLNFRVSVCSSRRGRRTGCLPTRIAVFNFEIRYVPIQWNFQRYPPLAGSPTRCFRIKMHPKCVFHCPNVIQGRFSLISLNKAKRTIFRWFCLPLKKRHIYEHFPRDFGSKTIENLSQQKFNTFFCQLLTWKVSVSRK